jgi:hypothetical protein
MRDPMTFRRERGWMERSRVAIACLALGAPPVMMIGCGTNEGVVGGACAGGLTDCNNQCVNLSNDPANCGSCGNACGSGSCVAGSCGGGLTDARAPHDSGLEDGRVRDASDDVSVRDGTVHDGTTQDSATDTGSRDGMLKDGTIRDGRNDGPAQDGRADANVADTGFDASDCVPPYDTPLQCGGCRTACSAQDFCSPILDAGAGTYGCVPICPSLLSPCQGQCVDETSDPDNCGACFHACPSGLCENSLCVGITAGDIVVIGHDYAANNIHLSEATLLANAVFIPPTNPLQVLSFEQFADPVQVGHVKTTLATNAPLGRTITYTVANDYTLVGGQLTMGTFDVLLVYDQPKAPAGQLGTIGLALASPLLSFVSTGGDVVVLDGASGPVKQMTTFLSTSNLLAATADTLVPGGDQLVVVAPGDTVGNFVLSPYAPISDTVFFTTSEQNGGPVTYVVDERNGLMPVVIHKTTGP